MSESNAVLNVNNLKVSFDQATKQTLAVDGISFSLKRGQTLGIVGESGSGKSVTSLSILNLLKSKSSNQTNGNIFFNSEKGLIDLLTAEPNVLQKIRGRRISMVFQEPMSSLNPVRRCGSQVKELLDVHNIGTPSKRKEFILHLFRKVSLPDMERIYNSYPHELSGGQLQRVNIAMALSSSPDILICDEPTTALDVTVQKQILELLKSLIAEFNIALIFISHDLDVVANICDSVMVMYNGSIVEKGRLPGIFNNPSHAYTKALIACKPNPKLKSFVLPTVKDIMANKFQKEEREKFDWENSEELVKVEDLRVHFKKDNSFMLRLRPSQESVVKAVDDISFSMNKGEILGIVGESGSGKSTVANCLVGLVAPTTGTIHYRGKVVNPRILSKDRFLRTKIQLVFQDPYSSLNPKMTIFKALKEPLSYHKLYNGKRIDERVFELLDQVGLDKSYGSRYPHQLSGGQRQRVCIARALTVNPDLLVCDESVSALDVSVQAQILNLLDKLRCELGLTILFISHDLSVVHYICDSILVMNEGKIVERGLADQIINHPIHTYTKSLIDSIL